MFQLIFEGGGERTSREENLGNQRGNFRV